MNTLQDLKPVRTTYKYRVSRSSLPTNKLVESEVMSELGMKVLEVSGGDAGATTTALTSKTPAFAVVRFLPTILGSKQAKTINSAFLDFYNKVTGSALQTTDIGIADLFTHQILAREFRAIIKDIDRLLRIYNQVNKNNALYGRELVHRIYGETFVGYSSTKAKRIWDMVSSHPVDVVKYRNFLASLVNKYLPLIKGSMFTAFDDMALDNIYADDPDCKTALIAFHRLCYYLNIGHQDNMLIQIDPIEFPMTIEELKGIYDSLKSLSQDIWYVDITPYLEHLGSALSYDAEIPMLPDGYGTDDKKYWTPVYDPEIIEMIKNAMLIGSNPNDSSFGSNHQFKYSLTITESSSGYLYQGLIEDVVSGFSKGRGLLILPNLLPGNKAYLQGKGKQIFTGEVPAAESTIEKIMAAQFRTSPNYGTAKYDGGSESADVKVFVVEDAGLALIASVRYYAWDLADSTFRGELVQVGEIHSNVANIGASVTGASINYNSSIASTSCIMKFNAVPYMYYCELSSGKLTGELQLLDFDNSVYVPKEFLDLYYETLALETIYDDSSVRVKSSGK